MRADLEFVRVVIPDLCGYVMIVITSAMPFVFVFCFPYDRRELKSHKMKKEE